MLEIPWASFNFIISVPVPLPALNPFKTSCNWKLAHRRVSISASNTFQRVTRSPIPHVSVVPFGIIIRTVHPSSCGISPVSHV